MANKFYITTSIPYLNSTAHLGHVLEFIQADVLARYHRLMGDDVFFLTGTDEHGLKIARSAAQAGKGEKEFVDNLAGHFREVLKKYNISNDDFIRTSDQKRHWPTVVEIWNKLLANEDLYKKKYKGFYCVGHEAFLKKSELDDGVCQIHQTAAEIIEEENWFLKTSKYKKVIAKLIKSDELNIVPKTRKSEILNAIADAEDTSVSRSREKLQWGIPVPNDPTQTIFVWVDALSNYISALGYDTNDSKYQKYWPADVHLIGKDILRFHTLIWASILLSTGIPLPKSIYVHGFITVDGQKMSKTIGNVIDPVELIKKYGIESVRYYLLRETPSTEDGDFSYRKLEDRYNGDLANNLGNLVSRTAKLIETKLNGELNFEERFIDQEARREVEETSEKYKKAIEEFRLHEALTAVWDLLTYANSFIDFHKPWAKDEDPGHLLKTLTTILGIILNAAWFIKPFLPETAENIFAAFSADDDYKSWVGRKFVVRKIGPLFPRLK